MNTYSLILPVCSLALVACGAPASAVLAHSSHSMPGRQPAMASGVSTHLVKAFRGHVDWLDLSAPAISGPSSPIPLPATAIAASQIQALETWQAAADAAGAGLSKGLTSVVSSPSQSGEARQFDTSYTDSGDERYSAVFASDPEAKNFLYDAWLYVVSPSDGIANLEFDMNQVLASGETVIYGVQCDGYTGTWDYTANKGTPEAPADTWVHSKAACNPRAWSTDSWHHVQVAYSRDEAGNVTYKSVWFDGAEQAINATVPSAFSLGWQPVLLTNFQVDGFGPYGSSTVYLDDLTVYRW